MSRRRGQALAPSLFPFLAVLVCTLGTLILLLALVAQNATTTAEQQARSEQIAESTATSEQPPRLMAETVETMLREERFRVEQLVAFRDQQTAELEERRDELTYLEDQMDRLRVKLRAISDEVERATGTQQTQSIDDATLVELRRRIDSERDAVEELRAQSASSSPRVVIVPHKGPNGTDRRPIYLECNRDGVTIWPEGSQISMAELNDAAYSANPLDAALRTVRLHAMQHYGDPISPYPLLLVRPDGIESYAAARRAMRDWDDQFGYELVPGEVDLAYGKRDPELKRRVDVAIRNAAKQQSAHRSIANQLGGGGHSSTGSVIGDARRGRRLPVLSAAQLDAQGRTSGFGSLRENRSPAGGRIRATPYGSGAIGSGTTTSPYSSGGTYGNNQVPSMDEATVAARRWANEMKTAADEMRDGDPTLPLSDEQRPGRTTSATDAGQYASEDGPATKQIGSHLNSDQTGTPSIQSAGQSTTRARGSEGTQSTQAAQAGKQTPPNQSAMYGDAPMQSAGQPGSSTLAQTPSQASSAANAQPTAAASNDTVRRQGRDWALPPGLAGMRGGEVVRTIRAECYDDRFVLAGSNDGATEVFVVSNGDVDSATLRLATALRDRIDRWGPALPGARWQPRLEVMVRPGGEMRFHQLRTLMTGSGIEVNRRTMP